MKSAKMTIWVMVMSVCLCALPAFSYMDFNDGGTYNIGYTIYDSVRLDWEAPGMETTVNLLIGGEIGGNGNVLGYNDSHMNMSGGIIHGCLKAYDNSQATISGGTISDHYSLYSYDNSNIFLLGGEYSLGVVQVYNNSNVIMTGGMCSLEVGYLGKASISGGTLRSVKSGRIGSDHYSNTAEVVIEGYSFEESGQSIDYGIISPGANQIFFGQLTGILVNGDPLDCAITVNGTSKIILAPVPIKVLTPNGGETLAAGSSYHISWEPEVGIENFLVEYSIDNGSTWIQIDTISATNTYSWTVPQVSSSQCLVKVTDIDYPTNFDVSDNSFEICIPELTLFAPNGGETLLGGRLHEISWTTECTVPSVTIEYSSNGGGNWQMVDTVPNANSYQWQVPAIDTDQCLIRVTGTGFPSSADSSDAPFSICTPSFDLLTPDGGEILIAGQIFNITWLSSCEIENVLLEYSTNNGSTWITIETLSNTGTYDWNIPILNSDQCLVRISDADYSSTNDVSSSQFSIYPSLLILISPNGGEGLVTGSLYEIKWLAEGTAQNIVIDYSYDAGISWNNLDTIANTGSYWWEVETPQSHEYLIRISDVNYPAIYDVSDSTFIVSTCQEEIAGDINGDCHVNLLDFALVAQNWLKKGFVRIFFSSLDVSPEWTMEGQWEFGAPTGNGGTENGNPDPSSGYTDSNVYGVNLNGDYSVAVGGPYCLIAGPFDCNKFHDMKLRFARWLNTDEPGYVASRIEVSNDGANWHNLWENTAAITDSNWQVVEYDVSGTADNEATVYFRWSYEILDDRAYPYSGWNIDDIELLGKF